MGTLRNKSTGDTYEVSDAEAVAAARENPELEVVGSIRVSPTHAVREGKSVAADTWKSAAGTGETEALWHEKHEEAEHDNALSTLKAGAGGFVDTATLGLVSPWEEDRKHHEIASGIGTGLGIAGTLLVPGAGVANAGRAGIAGIAGRIAAHTPLGAVTKLGARAGSLATRGGAGLLRSGVAGVIEGGVQGLGQTVSDVAHMDDLSLEKIGASLRSNVFYGGVAGGAAGLAARGIERGLSRAKTALDDIAARPRLGSLGDDTADLASLDKKGLRAAEKTEFEAIETGRIGKRSEIADEVKALRSEMKEQKLWLATKDADVKAIKEVREIGKVAFEADRAIDRMLRNPKALAQRPQRVLDGLQQQEDALERLVAQGDNLRPIFAADNSGTRAAALDYAEVALGKNRALQAKIGEVVSKPASNRLTAIADAMDALSTPKPQPGVGSMLGDVAAGHMLGAVAGVPGLGAAVAAGRVVVPLVRKLVAGSAENAARSAKAVGAFLDVARKVERSAPVVASQVLGSVRFSQAQEEKREAKAKAKAKGKKAPVLADAYRSRAFEIRNTVEPTPDGKVQMRMDARRQIAARLAPIRAANPVMADRLESLAAARVEFLASKLPRKPDLPGMSIGPDTWQPSDMEMRGFARYVAAVEDPHGVVERLADGSVTPEDAETMRSVYPGMYADIQAQIMMQLGELRAKLPYQRRLALSIFSDVPVDPALDPRVLAVLQGTFASEAGTEGGAQAPRAEPAFGSVTKPEPTAAQQRGA